VLKVSKFIGLPLGDESDVCEASDEESAPSDVERSVTSEHSEDGGLAISTCAVGPLLSMKVQRPRSRTLPTTQMIVFRSTKCGEGFVFEYSQKPSSFSVASQVWMCARRMVSSRGWCILIDLGRSRRTTRWSSPKKVCQTRSSGWPLSALRSTRHSYFNSKGCMR
jgi:hypothetical protein